MHNYKAFRNLLLFSLSFFLISCATIINDPMTVVSVHTHKPSRIIYNSDTLQTIDNKVHLAVARSRKPIQITAITDTLTASTIIKSRNSPAFYGNFGFGLPGFVVDWTNPKRYGYPKKVFLSADNTLKPDYKMRYVPQKGDWFATASLPHINAFLFQPNGRGVQDHVGFFGISAGVDYYYKSTKFINFTAGAVTDFMLPLPVHVDYVDNYEQMSATYATVSDNYKLKKFSVGYGVSISRNIWAVRPGRADYEPGQPTPVTESHTAIGAVLSSYVQSGRRLHLGLVYRPTLFRPGTSELIRYEHVISFDMAWKFRI